MKVSSFTTSLAIVLAFPSSTLAQDYSHCIQILEDGKFDAEIIDASRNKKSFAHSWFCRQSYDSNSSTKSANLEVVYEAITGEFDYSQESHNRYQSEYCSQDVASEQLSESTHIVRQIASDDVLDAWRQCIGGENSGLVCDATQPGENELRLEITIQPSPHNDLASANVLTNNLEFVFDSEADWSGPLDEGATKLLQLRRISANEPALIQVDAMMENTTATCDYRVPPQDARFDLDFERISLSGLIQPSKMPSGVVGTSFSPPGCTVRVTETLIVNRATVSADKTSLDVSYTCQRPDHTYNCGGGFSPVTDASYSASVNAEISVAGGRLTVGQISDHSASNETACGRKISEYIGSLQGTALDVQ